MSQIDRRQFIQTAIAIGATAALGGTLARASSVVSKERRDLFPEGVASGEPDSSSVVGVGISASTPASLLISRNGPGLGKQHCQNTGESTVGPASGDRCDRTP
jgi:TAT (twin-arginine translocation) pathway signal sequence